MGSGSEFARFQAAQDRISAAVSRGGRPSILDVAVVVGFSNGSIAVSALEHLSTVATDANVRAQFLADAIKARVRLEMWEGFEKTARALRRTLRSLPRKPNGPTHSLIVRPGDTAGVWALYLRNLALAYSRYLRKTGRSLHALRVLRRVARADGTSKHLAETEMGLLALDQGSVADAIDHFVASLEIPNEADLVLKYSLELLEALSARDLRSNRFIGAREKLQRRLLGM
jgi:hypothetical protein